MRKCEFNVRLLLYSMVIPLVLSGGMLLAAASKVNTGTQSSRAVNTESDRKQVLLENAVTKLASRPQQPLTVSEGDALITLVKSGLKDPQERDAFINSIKRAVRIDLPSAADQPVSCCPADCDSGLQQTLCLIKQYIGDPCAEGTLFSILCFIRGLIIDLGAEAWSIESKAEVISSKLDNITVDVNLSTVESKLDTIIEENWSIESKAEVISSKIDAIDLNITATVDLSTVYDKLDIVIEENWSIESKAEVISSKIDDVSVTIDNDFRGTWTMIQDIGTESWSIESKAEVISSKIDIIKETIDTQVTPVNIPGSPKPLNDAIVDIHVTVGNINDTVQEIQIEAWSIESKAEVISSKIDDVSVTIDNDFRGTWTMIQDVAFETWSIESKAEVISSKLDDMSIDVNNDFHGTWTMIQELDNEIWSIESKSEVISSKLDDLAIEINNDFHGTWTMIQDINVESWSIESKAEVISENIGQKDQDIYAFSACDTLDVNATTTLSVFQWLKLIYQKCK